MEAPHGPSNKPEPRIHDRFGQYIVEETVAGRIRMGGAGGGRP